MRYFFLLFFALNSFAVNWVEVSKNNDSTSYVDINSIQKSNGMVYFWNLWDFNKKRTVDYNTFRSTSSFLMTDCELNKSKALKIILYYKHMASGQVVDSFDFKKNEEWSYHAPSSRGAIAVEFACSFIDDLKLLD